jgi:hypothetical protein
MICLKRLERKIGQLEARRVSESTTIPPKRPVPDWLQATLESQGFVFSGGGQLISSPGRPARHKPDA